MTTEELEKTLALDLDKSLATTETGRMPKAFTPHMVVPKPEPSLADHVGKHIDIAMKLRGQLRHAVTTAEAGLARELADIRTSFGHKIDAEVAKLETARETEMRLAVERHHEKLAELAELRQLLNM
jgi:hypothetical protein